MRNRRNVGFSKTLKDYAVPIIGWIIILLFIINLFTWNSNKKEVTIDNRTGIELSLSWDNSEASIIYSWWKENKIKDNSASIYKWERIKIKQWTISFSLPSIWDFNLQKLWILEYKEDWTFFLHASDLWINTISQFNLNARYAHLNISENSSISVNQNEVATTIYVLKWTVEVSTLSWKQTILKKWQKINIWAKSTSKNDIDILLLKTNIDDYFKASDWFLKNNWDFYLLSEDIVTSSWNLSSTWNTISKNTKWYISLENIWDESSVLTPTIDLVWSFEENNIWLITINNTEANISLINKRFELKAFLLKSSINDIIFKIYDKDKNLLWKEIYTIYYSWWWKTKDVTNSITSNTDSEQLTFKVDATNFVFTAPDISWKFTTTDSFVTIKWRTPPNTATKVTVNWYQLKSYIWTSWRYHADVNTNNLKNWTNLYDIKYYDKEGNIIFKTYYTIIKKKNSVIKKEATTYSDEASIN